MDIDLALIRPVGALPAELSTLSSRAVARAEIEKDVAEFLARGGSIRVMPIMSDMPSRTWADFSLPGNEQHAGDRKPAGRRGIEWTQERLKLLRTEYHQMNKDELARRLGCSKAHLYNKASQLGLVERRVGGAR